MAVPPTPSTWVERLSVGGHARDAAVAELHEAMLRVARAEVRRRSAQLRVNGPELDDIAHQATADALVAVTAKLDTFRGESRFTTWAFKFVIFEVSSKMNRHFWQQAAIPLDAELWDRLPDRFAMDPQADYLAGELLAVVRTCVDNDLTARQRRVFVAIVVNAMPLDALAAELGSNRNAIYKTMFDARRKVRATLAAQGYSAAGKRVAR